MRFLRNFGEPFAHKSTSNFAFLKWKGGWVASSITLPLFNVICGMASSSSLDPGR